MLQPSQQLHNSTDGGMFGWLSDIVQPMVEPEMAQYPGAYVNRQGSPKNTKPHR